MSNEEVDDFLAHYGVLGMKWGVRKPESKARIERGNHTSPRDARKVAKADKKWVKKVTSQKTTLQVYNNFARKMNGPVLENFNNDPRWAGTDLTKDSPTQRLYFKEYQKLATKMLNQEAAKLGQSSTGARVEYSFDSFGALPSWKIVMPNE